MKLLGVGLVYWAALDEILRHGGPTISVVELEPQTLWEKNWEGSSWCYHGNDSMLERVASLPQAKLLHSVGHPVGGTVQDSLDPMPLLRHAVDRLNPVWVSEHLSFNRVQREGKMENTGFLLPPPQSPAAVRLAAHNINEFRRAIARPFAFETGVNYLRPLKGEMNDGDFFTSVAQQSNSGIVLDLHNLWCNERNGRQSVAEVLARIPLDRVWEIHLAGGMLESGYWLDAHSDIVPTEVIDIAANLIPKLTNLGALIFEILPEHLSRIGFDGIQRQIESLQKLWNMRSTRVIHSNSMSRMTLYNTAMTAADLAEVSAWESSFVEAIGADSDPLSISSRLCADPGCGLLGKLVDDFRRANLARVLHYTITTLLTGLGAHRTHELLNSYFEGHAPEPFAALEADQFSRFLHAHLPLQPSIPYLEQVLAFEHALVRATVYGASSEITWSTDPTMLLESLDAGRLPSDLPTVSNKMRICPSKE
jgi:uncharacterized protein (UPF0276 family)